MEDKKSEVLYRKAIKDFPDYSKTVLKEKYPVNYSKDIPNPSLTDIDVVSKTPILPFEKLTDVVSRSATKPEAVYISPYNESVKRSEKKDYTTSEVANAVRDIYKEKIGDEILKRKIDPYADIPIKSGFLSSMATKEQNEEKGLGGYYEPYTSNITIRSGLLPENYAGTYAHEAGHKIANQGLAIEGKSKASPEQSILIQDFMNPKVLTKKLIGAIKNRTMSPEAALDIYATQFATPLSGTVDPAKLVDKYYASHHRADAPSSWETQTLRNLESKGILTEPYTPEARPENIALTGFKKRYYELLKKKNK